VRFNPLPQVRRRTRRMWLPPRDRRQGGHVSLQSEAAAHYSLPTCTMLADTQNMVSAEAFRRDLDSYYTVHRQELVVRAVVHGARLIRTCWLARKE
jgi:hypothetical protein